MDAIYSLQDSDRKVITVSEVHDLLSKIPDIWDKVMYHYMD